MTLLTWKSNGLINGIYYIQQNGFYYLMQERINNNIYGEMHYVSNLNLI